MTVSGDDYVFETKEKVVRPDHAISRNIEGYPYVGRINDLVYATIGPILRDFYTQDRA